jgi:hypothetical protein
MPQSVTKGASFIVTVLLCFTLDGQISRSGHPFCCCWVQKWLNVFQVWKCAYRSEKMTEITSTSNILYFSQSSVFFITFHCRQLFERNVRMKTMWMSDTIFSVSNLALHTCCSNRITEAGIVNSRDNSENISTVKLFMYMYVLYKHKQGCDIWKNILHFNDCCFSYTQQIQLNVYSGQYKIYFHIRFRSCPKLQNA